MSDELKKDLVGLGLRRYVASLFNAGYDTWEIIADMIESDFDALDIRLGDRRKLQREIARRQFWPENSPLPSSDELRQFTLSLQEDGVEARNDGYFQHHVSEGIETEATRPQLPNAYAREEPLRSAEDGRPSCVARAPKSSDTIPSLRLGPAITEDGEEEGDPRSLSVVRDVSSDDDPTPRAVDRGATSPFATD